MNNVVLMGRLTRDPEVNKMNDGNSVARFSLAVDRNVKKDANTQTVDFINIVAFYKTAEFVEKYFFKGMKVALNGRIITGSYTNRAGVKIYTTEVVAEHVEFAEGRKAQEENQDGNQVPEEDGFVDVAQGVDDELPFH